MTTVVATPGQGPDRPQEVSYTDIKVIGNGSFGVVYQARLTDSQEMVAIKKVLQDKRFKVRSNDWPRSVNYSPDFKKKLQIGTFKSTNQLRARAPCLIPPPLRESWFVSTPLETA